jgi:deazaflavin-dependent oxidoreductase (nitroreductase family)
LSEGKSKRDESCQALFSGCIVGDSEFVKNLALTREIEITVTGRKTGRSISTPVWFVNEGEKLYLVPVTGTDSNWYKNALANLTIQLSAKGRTITVNANPIRDPAKINQVVEKLRSKYGAGEVKKYYSKLDAAIEICL